jgi:diguanylate cyclase (GGDEF)-like protein
MTPLQLLIVLLPTVGTLAMLFAAAFAFTGPRVPGRRAFGVFALLVGTWSGFAALEHLAPGFELKQLFGRALYLGCGTCPVAWLVFAARYTGYDRWLGRMQLATLLTLPLLTIALTATNSQHGWLWAKVWLESGPVPNLGIEHGWWFTWVHVPYSYLLFGLGLVLLVSRFFSDLAAYRAQIIGVVASAVCVMFFNVAYTQGGFTVYGLEPSPLLLPVFTAGIGWSLFRGLLGSSPLSYREIFMAAGEGVVMLDRADRIIDINPAAEALSALARPLEQGLAAAFPFLPVTELEAGGKPRDVRVEGLVLSVHRVPLRGPGDGPAGSAVLLRDVTAEWRERDNLESLASRDGLTQVLNRRAFLELVHERLDGRESSWPLGLLFLDLDAFKEVNDRHGHAAGDEVLRETARRVQAVLRPGDVVGRIGGDEFAVLLDRADGTAAQRLAGRLEGVMIEPYRGQGWQLAVGASIGWAVYPADGKDAAALLDAADGRMYAVKRERRMGRTQAENG